MVVGAALQCSSFSLGQLIAARLITGFGNGMNTSTVPTWQSETSKSHRRGQMVMIEGSLIVFGVMISRRNSWHPSHYVFVKSYVLSAI